MSQIIGILQWVRGSHWDMLGLWTAKRQLLYGGS